MSESVKAKGVSSRIVNDRGRVEGVMECHVEGDGLAMIVQYAQVTGIVYSLRAITFLEQEEQVLA